MKFLPFVKTALGVVFFTLSASEMVQAQFKAKPPVLDGVANTTEYGSEYRSTNNEAIPNNRDLRWHMSWDDSNLYIAVTGTDIPKGVIIYFDTNPLPVINGGSDLNGSLTGYLNETKTDGYDLTSGTLPFRADAVIYLKGNNRESRQVDTESGKWQTPTNTLLGVSVGNTHEISIPWSSISPSGSRPANFNWLGYIAKGNGQILGQAPVLLVNNTSASAGLNANFLRYFTVLNTGSTAATAFGPNGIESYSHSGPDNTLGDLTVYDFTLNTPGSETTSVPTINRGNTSSIWDIRGNLKIGNNNILNLSGSSTNVQVTGDINIFDSAILNFNVNNANLRVGRNILFSSPAQFNVTANVELFGNALNRTITGGTYPALTLTGNGITTLTNNSLTITRSLNLSQGTLVTGPLTVDLGTTGSMTEIGGYLLGNVESKRTILGSEAYEFGGIGLTLSSSPNLSAGQVYPGEVTAQRITGSFGLASDRVWAGAAKTIARRFSITPTDPTRTQSAVNTTIAFTYQNGGPDELEGNGVGGLKLFQSPDLELNYREVQGITSYDRTRLSGQGKTVVTATGPLALQDFFSLADGKTPLPVELISFTGNAENNTVRLAWATASELQNKGFDIEHRTDLSEWKTIGFVKGNGTTTQRHSYTYVDRVASAGNNYYRLRQIDVDGKSVYSQPVTVQLGAVAFSVSPVPTTDVLTLNGLGAGKHTTEIYNVRGQRVLSQTFSDEAATTLTVSTLPAGVYMVRVLGPDRSVRQARFIKQ